MSHRRNDQPVTGNAASAVSGLLARLGVVSEQEHLSMENATQSALAALDIEGEYVSFRHGVLVVKVRPEQAAYLRYGKEQILRHISDTTGTTVTELTIRKAAR